MADGVAVNGEKILGATALFRLQHRKETSFGVELRRRAKFGELVGHDPDNSMRDFKGLFKNIEQNSSVHLSVFIMPLQK